MDLDRTRLYSALTARDSRFDGLFFVGVTSTGIYCRPICPVKTPKRANCRFFDTAARAEQDGFRPCLRCRPELAPGSAPVDDAQRIALLIVQRLEDGTLGERPSLEDIASQFELSSRQIRRIVQKQLGVPPIQLLLTRRLLLAKQLLTETALPVTEIAYASGFSSLRRFNAAFSARYRMPPSRLRRHAAEDVESAGGPSTSTLRLSYRPPYDWPRMLEFLRARALSGVEWVTTDAYARTVRIGGAAGWIRVTADSKKHALVLEVAHTLTPVLPALLCRVRALFDLNARPDLIAKHLARDPRLARIVRAAPGLRVPGALDRFELGVRAILGQQVTVRAATTVAGRIVDAFGKPIRTPFAELRRLTPDATVLASTDLSALVKLGVTAARARSIVALARMQTSRDLSLDGAAHQRVDKTATRLKELPGIGTWTAEYIVMRAFGWPDAFLRDDLIVRRGLGSVTPAAAEALSQAWRPWRSYAVMHLWRASQATSSASSDDQRKSPGLAASGMPLTRESRAAERRSAP